MFFAGIATAATAASAWFMARAAHFTRNVTPTLVSN
jgi:hypothetical protein